MFAVIFEVNPRAEAWDDYLGHAATLRPELAAIDGFIDNVRYRSLHRAGWLVSLSYWRDEKALVRWRTHALHHDIQGKGRASIFADYHLRVGEVVSDAARQRLDTTETGLCKAVTLTERALTPDASVPNGDVFDSILQPGQGLYLREWADIPAARAGIAGVTGHHRIVSVIRDYGMTDRREAPQFFPG
jgi:heme-degrading monooxygenase HmoA